MVRYHWLYYENVYSLIWGTYWCQFCFRRLSVVRIVCTYTFQVRFMYAFWLMSCQTRYDTWKIFVSVFLDLYTHILYYQNPKGRIVCQMWHFFGLGNRVTFIVLLIGVRVNVCTIEVFGRFLRQFDKAFNISAPLQLKINSIKELSSLFLLHIQIIYYLKVVKTVITTVRGTHL